LVFVTGSDTGVGKTVLTALLTAHLRRTGVPVFAVKPFCSGGRGDADLLYALQQRELTLDEINPFYFPEPLAPLVAAREHHRRIQPADVLGYLRRIEQKISAAAEPDSHSSNSPVLLIEGAGGVLVPLAERFCVLDLIQRLRCSVLIVAPNRLGTINHCLLTIQALRARRLSDIKLVLMDPRSPDPSCASNPRVLAELIQPFPLVRIPHLCPEPNSVARLVPQAARLARTLSDLLRRTGSEGVLVELP